jgi:hypothetical protein
MGDVMCLRTTNSVTGETRVLLSHPVTKTGIYTEGIIFDAEVEGRHAIGGAFIEKEALTPSPVSGRPVVLERLPEENDDDLGIEPLQQLPAGLPLS